MKQPPWLQCFKPKLRIGKRHRKKCPSWCRPEGFLVYVVACFLMNSCFFYLLSIALNVFTTMLEGRGFLVVANLIRRTSPIKYQIDLCLPVMSAIDVVRKVGWFTPLMTVTLTCSEGHWIKDCPTNNDREYDNKPRIKRTTGIPRSMLKAVENPVGAQIGQGVMVTPEGGYVVAQPDMSVTSFTQPY